MRWSCVACTWTLPRAAAELADGSWSSPRTNAAGATAPGLVLSTSELQASAAVALYKSSGYRLVREEIAEAASNKTLGGGIRRYHFEKFL